MCIEAPTAYPAADGEGAGRKTILGGATVKTFLFYLCSVTGLLLLGFSMAALVQGDYPRATFDLLVSVLDLAAAERLKTMRGV
jgi:hypothetical protein